MGIQTGFLTIRIEIRNLFAEPMDHHAGRAEPKVIVHVRKYFPPARVATPPIGEACENVVLDFDPLRGGGVCIEHQVTAVGVRSLGVGPSFAGIDTCVVDEADVFRDGLFRVVPILE